MEPSVLGKRRIQPPDRFQPVARLRTLPYGRARMKDITRRKRICVKPAAANDFDVEVFLDAIPNSDIQHDHGDLPLLPPAFFSNNEWRAWW